MGGLLSIASDGDATTVGATLGTLLASVIPIASLICKLIIKIKRNGWKSINETEWSSFGKSIENEFASVAGSMSCCNYQCSLCHGECAQLQKQVEELKELLNQTKHKLLDHTSSQVEKNFVPEGERAGPLAKKFIKEG